jgi:hypothetical protein
LPVAKFAYVPGNCKKKKKKKKKKELVSGDQVTGIMRNCIHQPHLAQTYPVSVTRGLFINNQTLPTHSPPQAEEDDIAGVVPAVCASVSVSGQGALFVFGRRPCHLYLQQLYKDPNQSMTLLVMHGSQPHRSIMPVRAISAPGAPVLLYHHRFYFFSHTKALL